MAHEMCTSEKRKIYVEIIIPDWSKWSVAAGLIQFDNPIIGNTDYHREKIKAFSNRRNRLTTDYFQQCHGSGNTYYQYQIKKGYDFRHNPLICLVGTIGFEPTTPTVSGQLL